MCVCVSTLSVLTTAKTTPFLAVNWCKSDKIPKRSFTKIQLFAVLRNNNGSTFVTHTQKKKDSKTRYLLPLKPINQYSMRSQTPVVHTFPNRFRCQRSMAAFSPPAHTERREDGAGQVIYKLCFGSWTPLPASCLLFSTAEFEVGLHSVNLSLQGLRAFTLVCRRTEERNERRVVKNESG